jgi:purine-binding chemotaxis protein CheW
MADPCSESAASAVLFQLGGAYCAVLADQVARVVGAQHITKLPLLPPEVLGVVALGGKVAPVLDLRRVLELPASDKEGELILATAGAQTYALPVDRVLQIAAGIWAGESQWRGAPVRIVHVEEILERFLPRGALAGTGLGGTEISQSATIPAQQSPDLRTRSLAIETESSQEFLPLDCVVELSEELPLVAIPDPSGKFSGAVLHRDVLLPLVPLDALLGRAQGSKNCGSSFIVVNADGRRCALAVKRVVGLSAERGGVIDLRSLLLDILPEPRSAVPSPLPQGVQSAAGTRYLLVELAGHSCAFALDSVAHIHAGCHMLRAPAGAGSRVVGVTAIGGRVLPVLGLAALLGVAAKPRMQQFVELKVQLGDPFLVALDRVIGIVSIADDALVGVAEGGAVSGVARLDSKLVWILAASLIAAHGGATSRAA